MKRPVHSNIDSWLYFSTKILSFSPDGIEEFWVYFCKLTAHEDVLRTLAREDKAKFGVLAHIRVAEDSLGQLDGCIEVGSNMGLPGQYLGHTCRFIGGQAFAHT